MHVVLVELDANPEEAQVISRHVPDIYAMQTVVVVVTLAFEDVNIFGERVSDEYVVCVARGQEFSVVLIDL